MQYDKSLVKSLLDAFTEGQSQLTSSLSHCCSYFAGKDNAPTLRKYLSYMAEKGYVKRERYAHNIHRWSITKDGLEVLHLLNSDRFIK